MNLHFKDIFRGKVVNKRLTFNTRMDEFPRYVLEYLIDNYFTEATFDADFAQVKRRLRGNFVHSAEAERIRPILDPIRLVAAPLTRKRRCKIERVGAI
jgi:ATP-dependent Lon protease